MTPEPRARAIAPARVAAFDILLLVGAGRGHSDELLHSHRLNAMSGQDRNLATALVLGVLRWQIALDARIRTLLARPDQRIAEEVLLALRLGAFQLLHMDRIPPHAALSESVELCRRAGQEHAAGMVNAILRKLASASPPKGSKGVPLYELPTALAERLGHPAWLVERWTRSFGRAAATKICEADQRPPTPGQMFVEESGSPVEGESAGDGDDAADAELGSLSGGAMPVMDDGSRLVAEIAAAVAPGAKRVWDCCAAPGGKTAVLARRLKDAEILATDVSERRLRDTEQRLGALAASSGQGGGIRCKVADATAPPKEEGFFDLILCDVPCSGTGTLARNPEIRHRLRPEDLRRQAERQAAILAGALGRVAERGRLVYSTCSLEEEECQAVVDGVAARGWRRVDVGGALQRLVAGRVVRPDAADSSMIQAGTLRTLPGVHPCDGFYAVVLERDV